MSLVEHVMRPRQRRRARVGMLVSCGIALGGVVSVWLGLHSSTFIPSWYSNRLACGHAQRCSQTVLRGTPCARAAKGGEAAEDYTVGDTVQAFSDDDGQWFPGKIQSANDDGTYIVAWDDPDGGPETAEVGVEGLKKIIIFKDYVVGDDCKAESPDDNVWYPGTVSAINADGTFTVKWDDPDGGPETADIEPAKMKKVTVFKGYKVGDEVEAVFPDDGHFYPGVVSGVNSDGTFTVKWDDPDGGPEESPLSPKQMKVPPIPLDKLEVGAKYAGTVGSVLDFGAFVSFGAEVDGLVHISKVSKERVTSIYDIVEEGQEVEVWVSAVRDDGKVSLSMVEGLIGDGARSAPNVDVEDFEGYGPDEWIDGVVQRLAPFGAFVTVTSPGGVQAQGLVHISQVKDGFIDELSAELEEGQEVKVRVKSIDRMNNRISLSMLDNTRSGFSAQAPVDFSLFEDIPPDQQLEGTVARVAPFGAFVDVALEDGTKATGLVHITQIKEGFVESVEDELQPGQEVRVRVVSVDPGAGKLSLSMK